MDARIVSVTEELTRALYKLSDAYTTESINVKKNNVEITMGNELISLKVKYPRFIIDERIEAIEVGKQGTSLDNSDNADYNVDDSEEEPQQEATPKRKIKKK